MNYRRIISFFVLIVVFLLIACGTTAGQPGPDLFTDTYGGEGTEENPYEVGNLDELQSMSAENVEERGFDDQGDDTPLYENPSWIPGGGVNQASLPGSPIRVFDSEFAGSVIDTQTKKQVDTKDMNESTENIDSTLIQLIEAPDEEGFAERNGIDYRDGRVRVVVEMEEGFSLPEGYNTTNELNYTGQGENLAQSYVPVDELVPISNETGVEYVRLPLKGVPSQESGQEDRKRTENEDSSDVSNGNSEASGSNGTQDTPRMDEEDNQNEGTDGDGEGLSSVMGGIVSALIIILAAAYGRRKL
jgi:hypothetical protein